MFDQTGDSADGTILYIYIYNGELKGCDLNI